MDINVGSADRILRIIAGQALLSLIFWLDSPWRWLGLIGLGPLVTGLVRHCPGYRLIGVNTARRHPKD